MKAVSIVIPTLNEAENILILVSRIAATFKGSPVRYEIIFVDDHSSDGTPEVILSLSNSYPVRLHMKNGPRGKAYSLLEGFKIATYEVICMIDADLQYPPESILPMYSMMENNDVDIILTERVDQENTSKLRKLTSVIFHYVFTKFLFGFEYDTQSGLKIFRKKVVETVNLSPTPWSFDLEFIVRSLENGFKIINFKIPFSKRLHGDVKVQLIKVAYELATASIKLRFNSSPREIRKTYRMNLKIAENYAATLVISIIGLLLSAVYMMPQPAHALQIDVGINGTQTTDNVSLNYPTTAVPLFSSPPLFSDDTDSTTKPQSQTVSIQTLTPGHPGDLIVLPTMKPSGIQPSIISRQAKLQVNDRAVLSANTTLSDTTDDITYANITYPSRTAGLAYTYPHASVGLSSDFQNIWLNTLTKAGLVLVGTYAALTIAARHDKKPVYSVRSTGE